MRIDLERIAIHRSEQHDVARIWAGSIGSSQLVAQGLAHILWQVIEGLSRRIVRRRTERLRELAELAGQRPSHGF